MIFITGFHHSGTSILAEIIQRMGFNFGAPLDRHNEHEKLKETDDVLIGDWMKPNKDMKKGFAGLIQLLPKVEAYKNPRLMVTAPFWHEYFPNSKWIIITRHRYDVAESIMNDKSRSQDRQFWYRLIDEYEKRFKEFTEKEKPDIYYIHYEGFCRDSGRVIEELFDFLDKPYDKKLVNWAKENLKYKTYERN